MSDVVSVGGGTRVPIPEHDPLASLVDKRFFRCRHDAGVVARGAEEPRGSLNPDEATALAGAVMSEVLSPTSVEIWLVVRR